MMVNPVIPSPRFSCKIFIPSTHPSKVLLGIIIVVINEMSKDFEEEFNCRQRLVLMSRATNYLC